MTPMRWIIEQGATASWLTIVSCVDVNCGLSGDRMRWYCIANDTTLDSAVIPWHSHVINSQHRPAANVDDPVSTSARVDRAAVMIPAAGPRSWNGEGSTDDTQRRVV